MFIVKPVIKRGARLHTNVMHSIHNIAKPGKIHSTHEEIGSFRIYFLPASLVWNFMHFFMLTREISSILGVLRRWLLQAWRSIWPCHFLPALPPPQQKKWSWWWSMNQWGAHCIHITTTKKSPHFIPLPTVSYAWARIRSRISRSVSRVFINSQVSSWKVCLPRSVFTASSVRQRAFPKRMRFWIRFCVFFARKSGEMQSS